MTEDAEVPIFAGRLGHRGYATVTRYTNDLECPGSVSPMVDPETCAWSPVSSSTPLTQGPRPRNLDVPERKLTYMTITKARRADELTFAHQDLFIRKFSTREVYTFRRSSPGVKLGQVNLLVSDAMGMEKTLTVGGTEMFKVWG